jgi:hypothetical protein
MPGAPYPGVDNPPGVEVYIGEQLDLVELLEEQSQAEVPPFPPGQWPPAARALLFGQGGGIRCMRRN